MLKNSAIVLFSAIITYKILPHEKTNLSGKRVLITGASQNIGEEIAYHYSKLKASVILTSRNNVQLQFVKEKCKRLGATSADYIAFDVKDWRHSDQFIKDVVHKFGDIDIMVINHVLGKHMAWNNSAINFEYMTTAMDINYYSYVALATSAMPYLEATDGQIVIVTSGAGKMGMPEMSTYGASKAAVTNFFESIVSENYHTTKSPDISIVVLGAIRTNNKRWGGNIKLSGMSVKDAVECMVSGSLQHQFYVYCPWWMKLVTAAKILMPTTYNHLFAYLMS